MTHFTYKAERDNGEVYRATAEAADRFDLYRVVRREGGKIISVEEETGENIWSFSYWNSKFSTVPELEKVLFTRNLASMLKAGLPLSRSLAVLERQTRNARMKDTISQVAGDIRRGENFHSTLSKFPNVFSNLFTAMVRSGEESGDLPGSLKIVGEQMESSYMMKKKIRSALIYPAIIFIAIGGVAFLMLTQVVPTLAQTFEELGVDLPAATQAIISVSDFLLNNTLLALLLVIVVVGSFIAWLRTASGKRVYDFMLIHTPIIGGIVREANAARTARTMGSLLSAGVDMINAITITGDVVQNGYFKKVLLSSQEAIQKGQPLSREFSVHDNLYPPLVGEMLAVGEETGALPEIFDRLADYYEEEVSRKTKDMSTIIEPFIMIIVGIAVGFFAYAMLSPIYQLSEAI